MFVIPGLLLFLVAMHIWMVLKLGISEWPMPGRVVRRSTYVAEYNKLTHDDGIPFVPGAFWKDLVFSGAILAAVAICAMVFGPYGPGGQPDPSIIQTVPKPDFPFLWIYRRSVLSASFAGDAVHPDCAHPDDRGLLAVPFVAPEGEKSWHRRPVAVLALTTVAVAWGVFTHLGTYTPWSPHMTAWSSDPLPVKYLRAATPLVRQGAVIFQAKQCRNCHSIGGHGGERGPALDDVATRMTPDQMRFKVLTGGGNMPAYGKNLSPPEVEALVSFLETLHPANETPAADAVGQGHRGTIRRRRRRAAPNSHECRCAGNPLGHSLGRNRGSGSHGAGVRSRLAANSADAARAVPDMAAGRVSGRDSGPFCRRLVAARYLQRFAPVHAHGAALCADVGGAAADRLWSAGGADAARAASAAHPESFCGRCSAAESCPKLGGFLTRPKVAWLALNVAYIGWHIPRAYEFALSSENIHNCEHACFFLTSLLFWWPVIEPWPFRSPWTRHGSGDQGRWLLLPYLLLADVVNTGAVGVAVLLRAAALSQLRSGAAAVRTERAERPDRRGRVHVGHGLDDVPDPGHDHHACSCCLRGGSGWREPDIGCRVRVCSPPPPPFSIGAVFDSAGVAGRRRAGYVASG